MKMTYASTKKNAVSTPSTVPPSDEAKESTFEGSSTDAAASAACSSMPNDCRPVMTLPRRLQLIGGIGDEMGELDARRSRAGTRGRPRIRYATTMTAVVAAQRGQPRRSSGIRTGWQMITMTAPRTSGPTSSRANEMPGEGDDRSGQADEHAQHRRQSGRRDGRRGDGRWSASRRQASRRARRGGEGARAAVAIVARMDLSALLPTSLEWWQVLLAIVVIIAGWILSRFARSATVRLLKFAPSLADGVAAFVARFVGGAVILVAVGIALAVLGVTLQPLLALVVVLVVIAVLVLRGVADNFASGVVIQATRPIEIGDEVQVEGVDGKPLTGIVRQLTSRTVVLETYDGRTVHVPNGRMIAEPIVNNSTRGLRRSEVQVRAERSEGPVDAELARLGEVVASASGVAANRLRAPMPSR